MIKAFRNIIKPLVTVTLVALFLCVSIQEAAATLQFSSIRLGRNIAARNNQTNVLSVRIQAANGTQTVKSLAIRNRSENVFFGQGVSKVLVYTDANSNGTFEQDLDTLRATQEFFSPDTPGATRNIEIGEVIASGNNREFFIVYEIGNNALLKLPDNTQVTTNINFLGAEQQNSSLAISFFPAPNNQPTDNKNIAIAGFFIATANARAPSIVVPGQEKVPMLRISAALMGDTFNAASEPIIKIRNPFANFSVSGNAGITAVHLVVDQNEFTTNYDPNVDKTIVESIGLNQARSLTDTTEVSFNIGPSAANINFPNTNINDLTKQGGVRHFFVLFDIGEEFQVTSDTRIGAQFKEIRGTGVQSNVIISTTRADGRELNEPAIPSQVAVAGMTFRDLESIVPPNSTFGQSSTAPILKFKLDTHHAAVSLNRVTIRNNGSLKYFTNDDQAVGVRRIELYEDTNLDDEFDGVQSSDLFLGALDLGFTGFNENNPQPGNNASTAVIPITQGNRLIPTDNSKTIFVVYDFGERVELPNNVPPTVNARLVDAVGSANVVDTVEAINLSGVPPDASATPEAEINLQVTNLFISDITDISPTFAVQGQELVPMLHIQLRASNTFASTNVQILNELNSFSSFSQGVSKVWLYRDETTPPNKQLDDEDPLLRSNTNLPDESLANLNNVPLNQSFNDLIVLYDIGQVAITTITNNVRSQLQNVEGQPGVNLTFGGQRPSPQEPATIQILPARLQVTNVTINGDDLAVTRTISITVRNVSSKPVYITKVEPRFYLNAISGRDISDEFTRRPTVPNSVPATLNANQNFTFNFSARHFNALSGGRAFIDAFVRYKVSNGNFAVLRRYRGVNSVWFLSDKRSVVGDEREAKITSTVEPFPWVVPGHIKNITVGQSNTPFQPGNAIEGNSTLTLTFANNGASIDEGTITISLNGTILQNEIDYQYDRTTAELRILDIGSSSGEVVISVSDPNGNALTTATLGFTIEENIQITNMLFHPSPFRFGGEQLQLGFNLTQPATVEVYFFNFLGIQVHKHEQTFTNLGYHLIPFGPFPGFLKSGGYVIKMIARDNNGRKATAVTKLAVY